MTTENTIITHITQNSRYRIVIERAASSTKQIDGFKVEANGDTMQDVMNDAQQLYEAAEAMTFVEKAIPEMKEK